MLRCINTQNYVCDKCGYSTNSKPSCFPKCPACDIEKTYTSNKTKKFVIDPNEQGV